MFISLLLMAGALALLLVGGMALAPEELVACDIKGGGDKFLVCPDRSWSMDDMNCVELRSREDALDTMRAMGCPGVK